MLTDQGSATVLENSVNLLVESSPKTKRLNKTQEFNSMYIRKQFVLNQ